MKYEPIIIVGGGPCGLAAAIALQDVGYQPLVIEKGNIVHSLYRYPTHQTFFSTSDRLEIGGVPFISERRKPKRNEALVYYREVVTRKQIRVQTFEKVEQVTKQTDGTFFVKTTKGEYRAKYVIVATGYYDHPNYMNVPGEDLPKVTHYFKEGHPFYNTDCVVIGGKNSSVDAALELVKAGARVTVLYRGSAYSPSIKPWILPEFDALVRQGVIQMEFNARVQEITEDAVIYRVGDEVKSIKNDFVFAMTGYHPDHDFLKTMGVDIEAETGRPVYNPETMETNVPGIFIAGVIAAGNNANEIFIENGRFHGEQIAACIVKREKANPR
ncbi:YpdA family putative bacillithiol disulfide reductase [Anoxybacillus sp. J5B_2022]|uniref:YpdA family putative bacillithiol disulfide reductase n=1 Tax=Anoxybacillus sp. J5B_2022 TaxID=3003246 RepID=UPI002285BF41|nr:YpdA family putative bacillithiol disulfide reductase [Anoxybacillus sp. J5B_2022]MCZ0754520.1 YpdA family putative bacillithiol disulfide reductase [Anoxybacillus sp. J5B_2022]